MRPWKLKNTEPAFSCIEDVDEVATILRKSIMEGTISLQTRTSNLDFKSQIEQGV